MVVSFPGLTAEVEADSAAVHLLDHKISWPGTVNWVEKTQLFK